MSDSVSANRKFAAMLALAMCLALGVRLWNLNSRALNFDEVHEITHCTDGLTEIVGQGDGMPPTYFLLLAQWIEFFGSDISARWFSVLFGVATVGIAGLLGRQIGGTGVGAAAALLLAVSPMHVYHSQEARCYSLFCFCVSLVLLFGWKLLVDDRWRNWALFAAASWFSVATHYYGAVPVALMWLIIVQAEPRRIWPRPIVIAVMTGILLAPIIYCFWVDLHHSDYDFPKSDFQLEEWAYTYVALVAGYTFGPSMTALRDMSLREGAVQMVPCVLAIAVCGLPLTIAAVRSPAYRRDALRLLVLLIGAVLLLGLITRLASVGYIYRYMLWLVVPLCVLLAVGFETIASRQWKWMLAGGLLAISAISIVQWNTDESYAQDDFHGVAELLAEQGPSDPVLALPFYFAQAANYHFGDSHSVVAITSLPNGPQNWRESLPRMLESTAGHEHYWIVSQWLPHDDTRLPVRKDLFDRLEAELVGKVTTIEVYRGRVDKLEETVSRLDELPE